MAIERELKQANLKEVFFQVEELPVAAEYFFKGFKTIPGYKAIVDAETGAPISVVSSDYRLITNKQAFEIATQLIPMLFEDMTISDFEAYNVRMPHSKGACIIDLIIPADSKNPFLSQDECYTPFIRIWNSYNKTTKLKFEIGFCRWICLNGCIFGEVGFEFSTAHTKQHIGFDLKEIVKKGSKHLINVKAAWEQFNRKLSKVREIPMPQSLILAMYCKAFNITIDQKKVSKYQREKYATQAQKLITDGKEYFAEFGNNGYAMFNVLTDYASYPPEYNFNMNSYQYKVGEWLNDIVKAYDSGNFKLSEFIGEYLDTAAFLESLVPSEANK